MEELGDEIRAWILNKSLQKAEVSKAPASMETAVNSGGQSKATSSVASAAKAGDDLYDF